MYWLQNSRRTKVQHVRVWLRWQTVILTSLKKNQSLWWILVLCLQPSDEMLITRMCWREFALTTETLIPEVLWRTCWWFSSICRESCTKNLYQKDRLLTLNSAHHFRHPEQCDDWSKRVLWQLGSMDEFRSFATTPIGV
jgi:hypothetical protein